MIQSMLEHGACVNARSTPAPGMVSRLCTPLMSAVMKAHRNENSQNSQLTIEKLVAANSDLNAVDETGNTALILAVVESWDLDNSNPGTRCAFWQNYEMRRVNVSVCITLVEAGQTFCLYQMP